MFPNEWKHFNLTPVFKSGSKDNLSNFQPISVVPVIVKILEKATKYFFDSLVHISVLIDEKSPLNSYFWWL